MKPNEASQARPKIAFTVQQIIRRAAYEAGLRQALRRANEAVDVSQLRPEAPPSKTT